MFNISESYANKIYHKISNIIIKIAHVKGAKSVAEGNIKDIVIDVCEQQIERSKKGQKDYYSGKTQLMVDTETLEILSVHTGKGSQHDFKLFKNSKIAISKDTKKRVDLGYKGIEKMHKNVIIPHKKSKNSPLTDEQKAENS